MAFTRVQGNSADTGTSAAPAVTISAVGSGNAICGFVTWDDGAGATLTSVTDDKGNTYNLETTIRDTDNQQDTAAFSRTNITNAPTVITANLSVSSFSTKILVDEFSGASTASSNERDGSAHGGQFQTAPGTGTDAISSGTFTTSTNGDLIWGVTIAVFPALVASSGTGFSTGSTNNGGSFNYIASEYLTQSTAGSGTAATFTQGSAAGHVTYMIALKPAAGAAQPSGSSDYYSTRSIMEGIITSANPHLLQYDGFTPSPKVQAQGDAGYYNVEVIPPTKAGRPAFESYPPRGNVPSPTVPYGKTDYFDSRLFSQTLRGASPQWQQHDSYALRFVQQLAPPGAGGPVWFYDARIQLLARAGKPNIFTFPFDGFQPLGTIGTVAQVYGADSYYQSDAYPKLRFRDQHDAYAPRGLVPTAATPQGWTAYFDEDHPPKFKSALHPVDQDQTPDLPPFAATQGWTATFDSKAIKARPVREYEATGITFTAAATVVTGASDYQSFDLFQPFRSARLPYEAAYPAMGLVPTAATPQGWWTPLDVARIRPFGAQLQQHDGYQHFFPPVAVNLGPLGWSMYWDRGRKPLLPDRLPFLFEQLYQTPTATTPQGWTHNLDLARIKGFPARMQQYDALQRLSFVPPFIVPPGDWYDVRIIKPRARDYQVIDRPMFFPPPFPFDWVDARIIRPRAVSYSVIDQQPVVAVPPSAYVLFPELFKRPRPFPYLLWPEQRVAVLNTPAGAGGPTHYFDRRLAVFHRPLVDVLTYDYRGLPFVVVNLIIQKPGPAGLLSGVSLSATKAQDTLAGLKDGTGLQGEVEG